LVIMSSCLSSALCWTVSAILVAVTSINADYRYFSGFPHYLGPGIVAAWSGLLNAMLAISLVGGPVCPDGPWVGLVGQGTAVCRSSALLVYGSSDMFRHILPNCIMPIIVQASMIWGLPGDNCRLSFIGLGAQAHTGMGALLGGRRYLLTAWWLSTFPGWLSLSLF